MSNGAVPDLKYFSFGTAGKKVLSKYDFEHNIPFYDAINFIKYIHLLKNIMKKWTARERYFGIILYTI